MKARRDVIERTELPDIFVRRSEAFPGDFVISFQDSPRSSVTFRFARATLAALATRINQELGRT